MQTEVLKVETRILIPGKAGAIEALVSEEAVSEVGIICHPHPLYQGTMHNKVVVSIARAWQSLGIQTVRFNFRGVGESAGEYDNGIGEAADLESVLQWVLSTKPAAKIWLAGFSFGAYISLKVATHWPALSGLLSVGPALSLFDFTEIALPACPWLVIHGEQDEFIPAEKVRAWYEGVISMKKPDMRCELLIVPEGSHFFHGQLLVLKQAVIDFTEQARLAP